MRILVREEEKKIYILLPNWLIFNPLTAKIAQLVLKKNRKKGAPQFTYRQLRVMMKTLKKSHRLLKARKLHFVEVCEKEEYVLVDL